VLTCASCGKELPQEARFCLACGAPVEDAAAPRELRKTALEQAVALYDLKGNVVSAAKARALLGELR
jgi:predicted amidophosphoribosyltransferase